MPTERTLVVTRAIPALTGQIVEAGTLTVAAHPKPLSFMDAFEWMLYLSIAFFVLGAILTS